MLDISRHSWAIFLHLASCNSYSQALRVVITEGPGCTATVRGAVQSCVLRLGVFTSIYDVAFLYILMKQNFHLYIYVIIHSQADPVHNHKTPLP